MLTYDMSGGHAGVATYVLQNVALPEERGRLAVSQNFKLHVSKYAPVVYLSECK